MKEKEKKKLTMGPNDAIVVWAGPPAQYFTLPHIFLSDSDQSEFSDRNPVRI